MLNLEDKISPKRGNRNGQLGIITKAFSYITKSRVLFQVTFTDGKTVWYEESQLQTEVQWNADRDNVLSAAAALFQQGQR